MRLSRIDQALVEMNPWRHGDVITPFRFSGYGRKYHVKACDLQSLGSTFLSGLQGNNVQSVQRDCRGMRRSQQRLWFNRFLLELV